MKEGKYYGNSSKGTTNRWLIIFGTILIQVSAGSFYAWSIFNNGFMMKSGGVVQVVDGVKRLSEGSLRALLVLPLRLACSACH